MSASVHQRPSRTKDPQPRVILKLGNRMMVLRLLAVLLIPAGIGLMVGSFWALTSLPKVDGTLEPLGARIALFALMLVSGALFSIGLWLYCRIYVIAMERIGNRVRFTTTRVLFNTTEELDASAFHGGRDGNETDLFAQILANTPMQTLRITGRRLPLILDEQAQFINVNEIRRLRSAGKRVKA